MLASRLLKSTITLLQKKEGLDRKIDDLLQRLFLAMDNAYLKLLRTVLRHRLVTIFVAAVLLGGSLLLLPLIGTEFILPVMRGKRGQRKDGNRHQVELVDQQTRKMEAIVYPAVPEMAASVVSVGAAGWRPDSGAEGEIIVSLEAGIAEGSLQC